MFLKLFKYDFKDLIKKVAIFYIVILATACYALIMESIFSGTKFEVLASIPTALYYLMIPGGFIVPVVLCMIRYYQSMLSDEGYLTHTLPIKKSVLLLEKIMVTLVIILLSFLVVFLAIIIYTKGEMVEVIGDIVFVMIGDLGSADLAPMISLAALALLFVGTGIVMQVTTSLTMGGMHNKSKLPMAFVYYIVFNVVLNVLSTITTFIVSACFNGVALDNPSALTALVYLVLLIVIAYYAVLIVVFYFISLFVIKRKINLN